MGARVFSKCINLAAALSAAFAGGASADDSLRAGKWRITRSVTAPWSDETGAAAPSLPIGSAVTFARSSVVAPHPIGCLNARYEATEVPAEGLFQGSGLNSQQANTLGLIGETFLGVSITCDTGIFEYHRAGENSLLFALDNRTWSLDRSPGTRASANSPEGVVQRFLETHFASDMGFWPSAIDAKRRYFTKPLNEKMKAYFAGIAGADEEPEINGDPFTDSQDYPARFFVKSDDKSKPGVIVPVEYTDAYSTKTVRFSMKRAGGKWLIDDLVFEDNLSLSTLMTQKPQR
jgi:hypothetical protein